jgi:hypothetical protein
MEEKQVSIKRLRATEIYFSSIIFLLGIVFNSFPIKVMGGFGAITFILLYFNFDN